MNGNRDKWPIGKTVLLLIAVALLIGVEVVDARVPEAWRQTGTWSVVRTVRFNFAGLGFWMTVSSVVALILSCWWSEHLSPSPRDRRRHCHHDRSGLAADAVCPECGKRP